MGTHHPEKEYMGKVREKIEKNLLGTLIKQSNDSHNERRIHGTTTKRKAIWEDEFHITYAGISLWCFKHQSGSLGWNATLKFFGVGFIDATK